ncbi:MAG: butyrate kinase, partial [Caldisericaceae bacterium]
EKPVFESSIRHSSEELKNFQRIVDQYNLRVEVIQKELESHSFTLEDFDAFVGRGGLLHPIESGTYIVNEAMIDDLKVARYGEHASNLGAIIAYSLAEKVSRNAYIVDPVVVDEMGLLARFTGLKEIQRNSIWHALNQKAIARQAAHDMGKKYGDVNLVVVHLGGGISVAAHKKGKTVDVNNALNGDGPFAPERSGGLPSIGVANLCFNGKHTFDEIKKMFAGKGGLVSHLGTNNAVEVEQMIEKGDTYAKSVYEAMAYQIAKAVGEMATVLEGDVDAIVITGGLARSDLLLGWIKNRVSWIAKVLTYPGEDEMKALAEGALRVLRGEEKEKTYERI